MAEEDQEKTEAPTARRREEAREEGQIARSADLTSAALLLGLLLLMNSFGGDLIKSLRLLMSQLLSTQSMQTLDPAALRADLSPPLISVAQSAAPLLVGGLVIAVVANLLQVGIFFSPKRLAPNFGALNPIKNLGRLFKGEGFVHLLMNLFKITLVGLLAWSAVAGRLEPIITSQHLDSQSAFGLGASLVYAIGLRIAIALFVLALIDYGVQRWRHETQLKMSKQEIKEEMRRMEGDPRLKQRRRQVAIQMAMKSLKKNVPTADVIVTNPTHFAIALKYDADSMHAPRVVAKGQDLMAKRIRDIAVEHGIPIIERKPLARALYRLCQVGQEIPEQFYTTVAEILAYVYEISGKLTKSRSLTGAH